MSAPPILLDTNVASFAFGKRPELGLYQGDLRGHRGVLAFQTVAEMLFGADYKGWGSKKRRELSAFLGNYKIVHTNHDLLRTWGHLKASLSNVGTTLDDADLWMAATALTLDVTLVAHDAVFKRVPGLRLITHAT